MVSLLSEVKLTLPCIASFIDYGMDMQLAKLENDYKDLNDVAVLQQIAKSIAKLHSVHFPEKLYMKLKFCH